MPTYLKYKYIRFFSFRIKAGAGTRTGFFLQLAGSEENNLDPHTAKNINKILGMWFHRIGFKSDNNLGSGRMAVTAA